jgi:MYXO-CTERM domain-containing protein
MSSSPPLATAFLMRTAKAAILSVMALFVPGQALASALLLDHSISPAPDAIHSSPALGVDAALSVSCGDAAHFHFASHPSTGLQTANPAATPNPRPETLNSATAKRGAGPYGMALAGLALLGFIARRRHRVLNATD